MKLDDGSEVEYYCLDNWVAVWAAKSILAGQTYPHFSQVPEASVILDIGANCGAASVFLARAYPEATIYAFEPARDPFSFLERNAGVYPNIRPLNVGLLDRDDSVPLYHGKASAGASSIFQSKDTTDSTETIVLRSVSGWLKEQGIDRIDILKIDTEGCEVPILRDLGSRLSDIRVIYVEFHSVEDRAAIDELLAETHELQVARQMVPETGELAFLNRSVLAAS